jgi:FKBP-type peptidyl-prolyl cis-trans isomerase 2
MLLAACGSDEPASGTPTSGEGSPTANGTATASASGTPQEGGRVANDGDQVSVHYRGTLDSGEEFDSSAGGDPLEFEVGAGQVIAGFDDAVRGLAVGESRTVRIEPADAYGEHQPDLVIEVPASQAPPGLQPGDRVRMSSGQQAVVAEVTPERVKIDANHPLAGQALTFEIELVAVK